MEFIQSTRGNKQLLAIDGYVYSEQKKLSGNVILWDCTERRKASACNAKIKTLNGVIHRQIPQHINHQPDPEKISAMKVRAQMKRRAQNTMEKTRDILNSAVAGKPEEVLAHLPKEDTMKRHIRHSRQIGNDMPPVPQANDLQFVIPQTLCVTTEGDAFLQVDSFGNGDRMLMFASQKSMDYLSSVDNWYMDGTFDTLPPQFMQLYTIHGIKNGRNVVSFYSLLTNKRQNTYERMLRHIHFFTGGANPVSLNIDFEIAAINACERVFPQSTLSGCLFHLCQNVYKKVRENNLTNVYDQNVIFRTNIRMICAIAFVPALDVIRAFEILCFHCGRVGANEQVVLEYFERAYIGQVRGGVRRPPLFKHTMWNVYERVVNNLPRTTNAVEGWHNAFQRSVGQCHANVWKFISCLKLEHAAMHLRIAQDVAGIPVGPPKRTYRQLNEQIRNIVNDYPNRTMLDYLRAISYTIA